MRSLRAGVITGLGVLLIASSVAAQARSDTIVKTAAAPKYASATLVQEWRIGTADGAEEYQFAGIREVFIAKDGNIWIVDGFLPNRTPDIKVFDASGKFLRRVGRSGSGPGEFTSINGISQLPDGRVLLRDQQQARVNVYRADGKPDTTWRLAGNYNWPSNGAFGLVADPSGITAVTFSQGFVRLRPNGTIIDTLVPPEMPSVDAPQGVVVAGPGPGVSRLGSDLYAPRSMFVFSPLGYYITGINERYAFELHIPRAGANKWKAEDPVVSVRRPSAPAVPVNPEETQNQRAILQYRLDRSAQQGGTVQSGIPSFRTTKPAYVRLNVAADGRIIVIASTPSEKFTPPDPETMPGGARPGPREPPMTWRSPIVHDVFEPDGTYIGRIAMPRDVFPVMMRGDALWCVIRDADGVNFLVKYRIIWK